MTLPTPDDMLALAALFDAPDGPRPGAAPARKCRRHDWEWTDWMADDSRILEKVEWCARCHRLKDHAVTTRNRRNRARGNRTSHDLAVYLGGRSVEALGLPWDVEARGCRIQSKRDATARSAKAVWALVKGAMSATDLAAAYIVRPRQALASGEAWCSQREWVGWHGWDVPGGGRLVVAGAEPLIVMPLSVFRDWHISTREEPE